MATRKKSSAATPKSLEERLDAMDAMLEHLNFAMLHTMDLVGEVLAHQCGTMAGVVKAVAQTRMSEKQAVAYLDKHVTEGVAHSRELIARKLELIREATEQMAVEREQ